MQVRSPGWEDPLEKEMGTHSRILFFYFFKNINSHAQRSLVGYNPWGGKESDTTDHTRLDWWWCSHATEVL